MKVLYITDMLTKMGGAERNLLQLAFGLKARGYEPIVFCLKGGELKYELSKQGIEIEDLQLKRIYDFTALKKILKLVGFIRKRKIDLILTYHVDSDFLGLVLSRICRIPIISNRRDMGFGLKRRHVMSYRLANRFFDSIVAVSDAVRRIISENQKSDVQKIKIIHNGLDPSNFLNDVDISRLKEELNLNHGGPIVGCLANFLNIKGHRILVEAAGRVLEQFPDVHFLLVGGAPVSGTYHEISKLIKEIGIEKSFIFAGHRNDVPAMLLMMDISVLPSFSEGFSNAVLESMAAGKPVIASNVGGNPEAVVDGETGILVAPGDSQVLANAIITLLKDKKLAKKMGEAGRERILKQFTLNRMILAYEDIFRFIVKKNKIDNISPDKRI